MDTARITADLRSFFAENPGDAVVVYLYGSGPYVNDLKILFPYRGGCIAVFKSGTYFSPDCRNLRGGGGGKTVRAWGR